LSYNWNRTFKFIVNCPECKLSIYIENGFLIGFLRPNEKQCMHLLKKESDKEYCVKKLLLFFFSVSQCDISISISILNNIWYRIWDAHSGENSYRGLGQGTM